MRTILVAFVLTISLSLCAQDRNGVMVKAERLSVEEKAQLRQAEEKVAAAENALNAVKNRIKQAHDMKDEHWMEWSTRCEFDGDFIVFRYFNNMQGMMFVADSSRIN